MEIKQQKAETPPHQSKKNLWYGHVMILKV